MPKLETLKAKERKKERIQTRIARCEALAREERTNSRRPPPNSTVPSTSYLFASFRAEEGGRALLHGEPGASEVWGLGETAARRGGGQEIS